MTPAQFQHLLITHAPDLTGRPVPVAQVEQALIATAVTYADGQISSIDRYSTHPIRPRFATAPPSDSATAGTLPVLLRHHPPRPALSPGPARKQDPAAGCSFVAASGGSAVLVDQATQYGFSVDSPDIEADCRDAGSFAVTAGNPLGDALMRSGRVVVDLILDQDGAQEVDREDPGRLSVQELLPGRSISFLTLRTPVRPATAVSAAARSVR
jgi:hypothetical protein